MEKAQKEKPHYAHIIIGITASIFLYISSWELLSMLIPNQARYKLNVYLVIFSVSLFVIFWLAKTNPKTLK